MTNLALVVATIYLVVVLAAILVIDLKTYRIPNGLNLALLLGGVLAGSSLGQSPVSLLIGAFAGGGSLMIIRQLYARWTGTEGLGLGDIKFMIAAGVWTGWQGIAPLLLIASTTGILSALTLSHFGRLALSRQQAIPFGPFLSLALLLVYLAQSLGVAPWVATIAQLDLGASIPLGDGRAS